MFVVSADNQGIQVAEDAFQIEKVVDGITRIELASIPEIPEALARPVNVYVVDGPSPALINTGHPRQTDALLAALRSCDITPAQIERIIATSWRIDVVGAANQFPRADLFVQSPDMATPRDFEMQIDTRRRRLRELAADIAGECDDVRRQPVEEAVERYYPRMTRDLRFAPLRNGHFVHAGDRRFEVLATAGPGPGHMALYCEQDQLLFCGDFAMTGLPDRLDDTQAYLVSLERLAELPAELVLPNGGRTFRQGRWTVSRASNFLNNFLSNAPAALVRSPTVLEFVERDRGGSIDDPVDLALTYERFRHLFDELVRTRTIAAEGQGIERRYGIDVDDPRDKLRRHDRVDTRRDQ